MRKLVLFIHISLDGFVAEPKGEMDWIKVEDEMFSFAGDRTREADLALYGRGTYDIMQDYWPTAADQPNPTKHDIEHSTWYNQVSKLLISKTMKGANIPNTRIISENLAAEIEKIKKESGKEIIMFGSPTVAHSLIEENLIDDYWLFINPILLGQGIPLFKGAKNSIKLKLVLNKTFSSGVVCFHYQKDGGKD